MVLVFRGEDMGDMGDVGDMGAVTGAWWRLESSARALYQACRRDIVVAASIITLPVASCRLLSPPVLSRVLLLGSSLCKALERVHSTVTKQQDMIATATAAAGGVGLLSALSTHVVSQLDEVPSMLAEIDPVAAKVPGTPPPTL